VIDVLQTASTIDLRVDYLRPAMVAKLQARATVQRMGSHVAVVRVQAYQQQEDGLIVVAEAKVLKICIVLYMGINVVQGAFAIAPRKTQHTAAKL